MDWFFALFIGLPGWIALAILLFGFCILNIARGFWFFASLVILAAFAASAHEILYATFEMGTLYTALWGSLILVLFYGAGVEGSSQRQDAAYLTFCLLLAAAVVFFLLKANLGFSTVATVIATVCILPVYLLVGVWFALAKWKVRNRSFVERYGAAKRNHFAELRANLEKIKADQQGKDHGRGSWWGTLSNEELEAIQKLPNDVKSQTEFVVPAVLKEHWNEHVRKNYADLREPSLTEYGTMSLVLYWVVAWPVELIHFILDDLIVYVWKSVYNLMFGWLSDIQKKEFKKDPDLAS